MSTRYHYHATFAHHSTAIHCADTLGYLPGEYRIEQQENSYRLYLQCGIYAGV